MSTRATDTRLQDWAEWRGRVDQQLEDLPKQVAAAITGVHASIDALGLHLNHRLDDQDRDMADMRGLQREANGRTTKNELAIAQVASDVTVIKDSQQDAESRQIRRVDTYRWRIAQLIAAASAGGGLAAAAAYLHLI